MEILIRLFLGFVGVSLHCLKNFDSLKKDAKAIKTTFSLKDYLSADWISISFSIIAVLVWPFLFEEATDKYPKLEGIVRWSFLGAGALGSYIIQAFLGRGRSTIRSIANEKAETLDNIYAGSDGDPIPSSGPKGGGGKP